jgi:hypothetical protein
MDTQDNWLGTALWRQFGAAIDMLDAVLLACPEDRWTTTLWAVDPATGFPPRMSEFWYVGYHALVWLDIYFAGIPEEEFVPPPPFPRGEIDSSETMPGQPWEKPVLRAYLAGLRETCRKTLQSLTGEEARRPVLYPWIAGEPITWLELQMYSMRHLQEHAAQLALVLGQQADGDDAPRWIARAGTER